MTSIALLSRTPNLVDLLIPRVDGVATWRVQYALNFDVAFTTFQDVPTNGFKSSSVKRTKVFGESTRGNHRFIYNPADYSSDGYPVDGRFVWIRLIPIDALGVVGPPERELFFLPPPAASQLERAVIVIRGTAPNVVSPVVGDPPPAGSLQLRFPRAVTAGKVINEDAAVSLALAFNSGMSEAVIAPASIIGIYFTPEESYHRDLFVRGIGGPVVFSMTFDLVGITA